MPAHASDNCYLLKWGILIVASLVLSTQLQATPYQYSDQHSGIYLASSGGILLATYEWASTGAIRGNLKPKLGHMVSVSVGYEWRNIRIEVEYAFRSNHGELHSTNVAAFDNSDADYRINALMINTFYDFYITDSVYWYNGIGLGTAWVKLRAFGRENRANTFAWQVRSGVGYDVSEHVAVFLGYRLFSTSKAQFNGFKLETPFFSTFEFGVRYNF